MQPDIFLAYSAGATIFYFVLGSRSIGASYHPASHPCAIQWPSFQPENLAPENSLATGGQDTRDECLDGGDRTLKIADRGFGNKTKAHGLHIRENSTRPP